MNASKLFESLQAYREPVESLVRNSLAVQDIDYIFYGLVSEVGEVADVVSKSMRPNSDVGLCCRNLILELGDVFYYYCAPSVVMCGMDSKFDWLAPIMELTIGSAIDYLDDNTDYPGDYDRLAREIYSGLVQKLEERKKKLGTYIKQMT
jgi:NTP pyrophosphatase (non-canonical NTP hydrolase)